MKRDTSRSHILDLATALPHEEPETLSSWILTQQQQRAPDAHGKLTQLLTAIAVSCKFIATAVRKVRCRRWIRRWAMGNLKTFDGQGQMHAQVWKGPQRCCRTRSSARTAARRR